MTFQPGGGHGFKSWSPWSLRSDSSSTRSGSSSRSSNSSHRDHQRRWQHTRDNQRQESKQRAAALEIVAAFNRNNIEAQTISSFVSAPDFTRLVLPTRLGQAAQDAAAFQRTLNMYRAVFRNYALDVHDIIDDVPARKICLWLTASAITVDQGRYTCDMIWTLTFDDSGTKIVEWREFIDTKAGTMDHLPENMGV